MRNWTNEQFREAGWKWVLRFKGKPLPLGRRPMGRGSRWRPTLDMAKKMTALVARVKDLP